MASPSAPSNTPRPKRPLLRRRANGATAVGGPRQDGPKQPGRWKQIWQFYQQTSKIDRTIPYWFVGIFLAVLLVGVLLGFLVGHPVYLTILFLPLAFLVAMIVTMRRAEKAAYGQIAEQQGASIVALRGLRGGWSFEETPVAVDPRHRDVVFRVIGPAGIVLVGDGQPGRLKNLLAQEEKKHRRVAASVPLHVLQAGPHEGQIPVDQLARHVMKLRNPGGPLQKNEIAQVQRRMRAIGGMNPAVPKGMDPTKARIDRRGMRGR